MATDARKHDLAVDELEACIITILNFATNAEGSNLYPDEVLRCAMRAVAGYINDEELLINAIETTTQLKIA